MCFAEAFGNFVTDDKRSEVVRLANWEWLRWIACRFHLKVLRFKLSSNLDLNRSKFASISNETNARSLFFLATMLSLLTNKFRHFIIHISKRKSSNLSPKILNGPTRPTFTRCQSSYSEIQSVRQASESDSARVPRHNLTKPRPLPPAKTSLNRWGRKRNMKLNFRTGQWFLRLLRNTRKKRS